jgi:predicted N-acetyltransferase YhbS
VFEPINTDHVLAKFDCGKPPLNHWLQNRALANHAKGFTSVQVACRDKDVIGYYGLAPTAVSPSLAPRSIRTGQPPDPLPCILLGRLAVDLSVKGQGLGASLLHHALRQSVKASQLIGGRAVLVSAIDEDAAGFWRACGFHPSQDDPYILFMGMVEVEKTLASL